jgi:mxaJ protein
MNGLPLLAALARILTVCAEPDNLPFSNERREGFDNQIVELVARELQAEVEYVWQAPRRPVLRSLRQAGCDLAPGMPSGFEGMATSRPYYRSTYVFVQRANDAAAVHSLDDPALLSARIGLHLVRNGYAPPGEALALRGLSGNLRGYSLFGEGGETDPTRLLAALSLGEVDVAIVWGPIAGDYRRRVAHPLSIAPVPQTGDVPFRFDISMGVLSTESGLLAEIDRALAGLRPEIEAILDRHGVPRTP